MLEEQKSEDELTNFYNPDIEQTEFPNAVTKTLTTRTLIDLKAAFQKGSKLLTRQKYEVNSLISVGNTVVLECIWKGIPAIPLGNIPVGGQMIAHFAQIFEFKDDKIYRQRNYDCFEPF
jgi:hypothetical protein